MIKLALTLIALTCWGTSTVAQTITKHPDRFILHADSGEVSEPVKSANSSLTVSRFAEKSGVPSAQLWFVPEYFVDRVGTTGTTLWAARNEGDSLISLVVEYFDVFLSLQRIDVFSLPPDAVTTVNLRNVTGLAVDPDGFSRGTIRLDPSGPISVDFFHTTNKDQSGSGDLAFTLDDFCETWQTRFFFFGVGEGSILTFFVNGPQGAAASDPPSVIGNVFGEDGVFINAFEIRGDATVFNIRALDLVLNGTPFGSIELAIASQFVPRGFVSTRHDLGQLGAVVRGVCKD